MSKVRDYYGDSGPYVLHPFPAQPKGNTRRKHPRCPQCGLLAKTAASPCASCKPATSAHVAAIPWQKVERDQRFAELDREIRANGGEHPAHEGRELLTQMYRESLLTKKGPERKP